MKLEIVFRGTDPSDAMEKYVIKYVKKFKKYVAKQDPESTFVHVVLEGKLNHHLYMVEVRLKSQLFNLVAKRDGADMYALIDETMHVMERELQKHKQRVVDDIKKRTKGMAFIFIAAINLCGLLYSKPIKILNWNVLSEEAGIRHRRAEFHNGARFLDKEFYFGVTSKIPTIPHIVRGVNPDIIFMQEINSDNFLDSLDYKLISWEQKGVNGTGTGIFVKNEILHFNPVVRLRINCAPAQQNPVNAAVAGAFLLCGDSLIFVMSLHVPNHDKNDDTNVKYVFQYLEKHFLSNIICPVIIAGDFNASEKCIHGNLKLLGVGYDAYDGTTVLENKQTSCIDYVIFKDCDLDVSQSCIGSKLHQLPNKRIMLCEDELQKNVKMKKQKMFHKFMIFPSDHDPVVCTLNLSDRKSASLDTLMHKYKIALEVNI